MRNDEPHVLVIADDITGAAEMAGIAFSQGQQVRLVCGSPLCCNHVAAQTTVIATDTRSMSETEAVAETQKVSFLISHPSFLIYFVSLHTNLKKE